MIENNMPYYECPNFDSCSATKCYLDPDIKYRIILRDDAVCTAKKSTRKKIGIKYPELLPYQGLTIRNFRAMQKRQGNQSLNQEDTEKQGALEEKVVKKWHCSPEGETEGL